MRLFISALALLILIPKAFGADALEKRLLPFIEAPIVIEADPMMLFWATDDQLIFGSFQHPYFTSKEGCIPQTSHRLCPQPSFDKTKKLYLYDTSLNRLQPVMSDHFREKQLDSLWQFLSYGYRECAVDEAPPPYGKKIRHFVLRPGDGCIREEYTSL